MPSSVSRTTPQSQLRASGVPSSAFSSLLLAPSPNNFFVPSSKTRPDSQGQISVRADGLGQAAGLGQAVSLGEAEGLGPGRQPGPEQRAKGLALLRWRTVKGELARDPRHPARKRRNGSEKCSDYHHGLRGVTQESLGWLRLDQRGRHCTL